jgi:hypothetical protein
VLAYVHEYAHAVFGERVGNVAERSRDAVYNPVNEGFAVTVERMVMDGMLRERGELGLSQEDAKDVAAMREARRKALRVDDNFYSEGRLRVWRPAQARGGEAGVKALLGSLKAQPLLALQRQDAAYQLSQGQPEKLRAALAGAPASVQELLDTAPRRTLERFFALHLDRQQAMDVGGGQKVLYSQRWKDGFSPQALFSLVAGSKRAGRALSSWLARKARAGKLDRVFEADGFAPEVRKRVAEIVSGAERLPWGKRDHSDWKAAVGRWLVADRSSAPK